MISGRSKSAAAKAKRVKLGNPRIKATRFEAVAAIKAEAKCAESNGLPIVVDIQNSGTSTLRAIAEALISRGVTAPRRGRWHAMSVPDVLSRA